MKYQMHVEKYFTNNNKIEVLDWYVHDDQYVRKGDIIVDLESSEIVITVESKYEGYIKRRYERGASVVVGSILADFSTVDDE